MAETTRPHILIIGAGIGGLSLAQCLRAKGHPFTVFERDSSPHHRSQGWAIALHTILAELMASVPDDMPTIDAVNHLLPLTGIQPQLCFYDAQSKNKSTMAFVADSKPAEDVGFGPGRVIRANRDKLRDWLATNIDIQWGRRLAQFEQDSEGVSVTFADGTTARGAILVGADGARSAVRQALLPGVDLNNVPECFITGEVTLSRDEYEQQLRLGHSAYAVGGDSCALFVGLKKVAQDAASADYYWDLIWHDDARSGSHWIDTASAEELHDFVLNRIDGMDPKFTKIMRMTEPQNVITPPLILRDLVLQDMPVSRVTLLGDAAHAMLPFRGEGGCHAIDDALKLAKVLTENGTLYTYQQEMLPRGASAVLASRAAGSAPPERGGTEDGARVAWGQPVRPRGGSV